MRVRNVHRRVVDQAERAAALIDGLGGSEDRLWPADRWPAMRLDRPLQVGARGGHGPIRYAVEVYEPGQRVRFRFERPRGFHGFHEFNLLRGDGRSPVLMHVLEARFTGMALVSWPVVFRPLHDALIEDALDNAQRAAGDLRQPASWSRYVHALRRAFTLLPR
jgi:hypothetical protein